MKNLLVLSAFLGLAAAGCSSPCDTLADLCAKCKDAATKSSCENAVSVYKAAIVGGSTGCQSVLDSKAYDSCN